MRDQLLILFVVFEPLLIIFHAVNRKLGLSWATWKLFCKIDCSFSRYMNDNSILTHASFNITDYEKWPQINCGTLLCIEKDVILSKHISKCYKITFIFCLYIIMSFYQNIFFLSYDLPTSFLFFTYFISTLVKSMMLKVFWRTSKIELLLLFNLPISMHNFLKALIKTITKRKV